MNIKAKRILYIFFIALFFIINPLILLYSSGFRFNYKKFKIEKTGAMIIESSPKKAKIYVDNSLTKFSTPAKIRFLHPDIYTLNIKKDSYFDWTKDVLIQSGLTTFLKNIILVKKDTPRLAINGDVEWIEPIKNTSSAVYLEKSSEGEILKLFDTRLNTSTALFIFPAKNLVEKIGWSNDKNKLLLSASSAGSSSYYILSLDSRKIIKIPIKIFRSYESIKWDNLNSDYLYALKSNILYQVNTLTLETRPIFAEKIIDYAIFGLDAYYISKENNSAFLYKKTLFDNSEIQKIELPDNSNYSLDSKNENMVEIINISNNNLYIIDTEIFQKIEERNSQQYAISLGKSKNTSWANDGSQILFYNDYEIYSHNLKKDSKNIIDRSGTGINKAIFALDNNYVLYQTKQSLHLTENSSYIKKNSYTIIQADELRDFSVLGKKENTLLFTGKIGQDRGIFIMELGE